MLQSSFPQRQQAHALIDRLTPEHLAVAICLLQTMADVEQAAPRFAAFCDDAFPDRERVASASEKLPPLAAQGVTELGLKMDDTDFWPLERRPRFPTHA